MQQNGLVTKFLRPFYYQVILFKQGWQVIQDKIASKRNLRRGVHVDLATRKSDGPHKKKFIMYLGIITQDMVDATIDNWKQVPIAQKDLIWEDIQVFQLNVECCCNWLY